MLGKVSSVDKKVAAIDCGTNSIRLLIAKLDGNGGLNDIAPRLTRINRLGYGVDRNHNFDNEALKLTFEFEQEFAAEIAAHEIDINNIRFIATSASRDADNRDVFFNRTHEILGVYPEVISGDEEARLSFEGVSSAVDVANYNAPKIVVDLGGGSTEIIYGDSKLKSAHSMNIGSVRLTERYFASVDENEVIPQAVIDEALIDVREHIRSALEIITSDSKASEGELCSIKSIIGVAGTVTTLTAFHLGLEQYSRDAVDSTKMTITEMVNCANKILSMPKSEIRKLSFILPGRVDVIQAGALIWREILLTFDKMTNSVTITPPDVICSEHDILDGIALNI